jgi:glucokinase
MTVLLAGDVGGTKTLLATYRLEAGHLEQERLERYPSAGWDDFAAMVGHFLGMTDALTTERPRHACFAIAGPVQDGQVTLTNLPWHLEEQALASACGLERLELVNDFAVLIYGIPHFAPDQQQPLRERHGGPAPAGAPLAILGAGTGLGVAVGVPGPNGLIALASEAAHASFAPASEAEWALREWIRDDLDLERVSIERIASGTGLGHVARWLLAVRDPGGTHPLAGAARSWREAELAGSPDRPDLPALVTEAADRGDPLALAALQTWLGAYGSVAGDLALQSLCRGGLWVGGGTAGKLLHHLRSPAFLEPFGAKGRLSPVLSGIPLQALIDPGAGLFSAACRARMLLD